MKKEKKENKDVGFVITELENEEHNEATSVMETVLSPPGDLSYPKREKKKGN